MTNRLLFLLLLLLPLLSEAQALKAVKKRSKYLLEQFEVLADNDTMRAGSYKKMWIDTKQVLEEGRYEANHRVGIWTFYGQQGQPELQYDYSAKKVISTTRSQDIASLAQIPQGDTLAQVHLAISPVYLASSYQIFRILAMGTLFPAELQRAGISELRFKIVAFVSEVGPYYRTTASNPDKQFAASYKQAMHMALDGVEWLPAQYQGRPVTATYTFNEVVLMAMGVSKVFR